MAPFALLFHLTHFLVEETEVQGQGAPCISRPCQRLCPHLSQANLEGSDPAWVVSPPSAMYNILPGFQLQISQLKTNHSFLEGQVPRPQTWHNRCFLNTRTIGRETEMQTQQPLQACGERVLSELPPHALPACPGRRAAVTATRAQMQQRPRGGPASKLGLEPVPRTWPGPLPPALAQRRGFLSYPASALGALSSWMPLLKGRREPSGLCSPPTPFGDYFLNMCLVPGAVPGTGGGVQGGYIAWGRGTLPCPHCCSGRQNVMPVITRQRGKGGERSC